MKSDETNDQIKDQSLENKENKQEKKSNSVGEKPVEQGDTADHVVPGDEKTGIEDESSSVENRESVVTSEPAEIGVPDEASAATDKNSLENIHSAEKEEDKLIENSMEEKNSEESSIPKKDKERESVAPPSDEIPDETSTNKINKSDDSSFPEEEQPAEQPGQPEMTAQTEESGKSEDTARSEDSKPDKAKDDEGSASERDTAKAPSDDTVPVAKTKKEPVEKVNYKLLSKEDLVDILEEDLNTKPFDSIRSQIEDIRNIFDEKMAAELEAKKQKFIDEGGNEEDFKPMEDPLETRMNELVERVRSLKSDFNKQQEENKEKNLAEKQEVLEELRLLMDGQESFENTFRKFKQLQKRWFDSGFVPQQNVKDLWNSYNYFVDKFNDYVKINRELRALDLKKNMELKIGLCEKVEALAEEEDVVLAFKTLQKYHAQWREAGPVPREEKDALWERFKAATAVINKSHQSHQSEMRVSLVENLEKKQKLCEKAEEIAEKKYDSHREWNDQTHEILGIQKEWKTIGYAPKKDNNLIYARFRKACDQFFEAKAAFYAETFEKQKDNLQEKETIVEKAEELKESKDWKDTTNKLIELQKKWKEIGPVPRRDSDRLWKRFRAACDYFFTQKSAFYQDIDSSFEDNLKAKLELIEEMRTYKPSETESMVIKDIDEFNRRYAEIGFVPVEKKEEVREDFKKALNEIFDKLDLDEQAKSLLSFRSRMLGILNSPKAESKFHFEREKLHTRLQQLKNDLAVWENNIGFIKQTESSEGTISGYEEKLNDAKARIQLMTEKIKLIDELENEL